MHRYPLALIFLLSVLFSSNPVHSQSTYPASPWIASSPSFSSTATSTSQQQGRVQVVYEGQNVKFYCNATGAADGYQGGIDYHWEFQNGIIIATDGHFKLYNVQKHDEGSYKCIAQMSVAGDSLVSLESIYLQVRKPDKIQVQEIEEGLQVRILCDTRQINRDPSVQGIRFEWRDPFGQLVGSSDQLILDALRPGQSGIYVCRVDYEQNNQRLSTSSATDIRVIRRAGIKFPGVSGDTVEVLETGDLTQRCQIIGEQNDYDVHWVAPSGQRVSSTDTLRLYYLVNPKDAGAYRCVARSRKNGRRNIEASLDVVVTPLRFEVRVISEQLTVPNGYSNRRVELVPSSNPRLSTRETFTYSWLNQRNEPMASASGPGVSIQLMSPSDFGRYSVLVKGVNSGYEQRVISQVSMNDGTIHPVYSVTVDGIDQPLYFNSRLQLVCNPKPDRRDVRVNWLGPKGQIVSDNRVLYFERFLYENQGRYICQISFPNNEILKQSVDLFAGDGGDGGDPHPTGKYRIAITVDPREFRYDDRVLLHCLVWPDPPAVNYEWSRDGQTVGRSDLLEFPNFSPSDVGRYQCVARIAGEYDLTTNIEPTPSKGGGGQQHSNVYFQPRQISVLPFNGFQLECVSQLSGHSPQLSFSSGARLDSDRLFQLQRPDAQTVVVYAPRGLSGAYNGLQIICSVSEHDRTTTTIYINDRCNFDQLRCLASQECIGADRTCDGRPDCSDRSDESELFCNAALVIWPPRLVVQPGQQFELFCRSIRQGQMPYVQLTNSAVNLETDPRFLVQRPSTDSLKILALNGLQLADNNTQISCYLPNGGVRTAVIQVRSGGAQCSSNEFACLTGRSCIPRRQVCDGVIQCYDGSDERDCACSPPNIQCPTGECIQPAQRCNGVRDCRDGFDELQCACPRPNLRCTSGECISPSQKCDGRRDCQDGFDERDCDSCPSSYMRCPDGACIRPDQVCNGVVDCVNGFDELNCDSSARPVILPEVIVVQPYGSLQVECRSTSRTQPNISLVNPSYPGHLPSIEWNERRNGLISVRLTNVTERHRDLIIKCICPSGESTETGIIIQSPCDARSWMCRDGSCVDSNRFCDQRTDCRDGSDEQPPHCIDGEGGTDTSHVVVAVRPPSLVIEPYKAFEVECWSSDGRLVQPSARLVGGRQLELDRRFELSYPSSGRLLIRAPQGVTDRLEDLQIECQFPGHGSRTSSIRVIRRCRSGYMQCRNGTCRPIGQFCNSRRDCADGSDEDPLFCQDHVPGPYLQNISVEPYAAFELICQSPQPHLAPLAEFADGRPLESDRRFSLVRPSVDKLVIRVNQGLSDADDQVRVRCRYDGQAMTEWTINIIRSCQRGFRRCRYGGNCIPQSQFCNGRTDCVDGSDESLEFCGRGPVPQVLPTEIVTNPYTGFEVECISQQTVAPPIPFIGDFQISENNQHFTVVRRDPGHIVIRAVEGVNEIYNSMAISCLFPGVGRYNSTIKVVSQCPSGYYTCGGGRGGVGQCLPASSFCDGKFDCPDGSDENSQYCRIDVTITPSAISVAPYEPFTFECTSTSSDSTPYVRLLGTDVRLESIFNVRRPQKNRVIVQALQGIADRGSYVFECSSVTGSRRTIVVNIETNCTRPSFSCRSGDCVDLNSLCNGRRDCYDGSDEDPTFCQSMIFIVPGYVSVHQDGQLQFICQAKEGRPYVQFLDGRRIEDDNRFYITRPTERRIVVSADLRPIDAAYDIGFVCYTAEGTHSEVTVYVDPSKCYPGQFSCGDGQCVPQSALCNGVRECRNGADERSDRCKITVTVTPSSLIVQPDKEFSFDCESGGTNLTPEVLFDGRPLSLSDPRFSLQKIDDNRVRIHVHRGLTNPGNYTFVCRAGIVDSVFVVRIDNVCASTDFRCHDGLSCIASHQVCDQRVDCRDGSDESPSACAPIKVSIMFTPRTIRVQPYRPIRLECSTSRTDSRPSVYFESGRDLEDDRRFTLTRPRPNRVVVEAPNGLDANTPRIVLVCTSPTGERQTATIHIEQSCQPGQRRCPDAGPCIHMGQFCDGRPDCPDGSDELPSSCSQCDPITKRCEVYNQQQPRNTHYQVHWRCDGDNDCGNGWDERDCQNNTRSNEPNCRSHYFQCRNYEGVQIPFSYICDGVADCPNREDEADCAKPAIITQPNQLRYTARPGQTVTLECQASGSPPPKIIWRFNWGCLRDEARMIAEVASSSLGCRGSRSRLVIRNYQPDDAGIYNCEALSGTNRAMSQDIYLLDENY